MASAYVYSYDDNDGQLTVQTKCVQVGLVAAALTTGIALASWGIVTHTDVNWSERELTPRLSFVIGTIQFVGAGLVLLGLLIACVLYHRNRARLSGSSVLPLPVFAIVTFSFALTLVYSAILNYSVESDFWVIPQHYWDETWFLVLVVQIPYWVSKTLTIVPLSALLLRLVLLYYGTPQFVPPKWLPPNTTERSRIRRLTLAFVVVASAPLLIAAILDTIRVVNMTWEDEYNPVYDYFQVIYLMVLTGFDMILVFALYWARSDLRRYDLDRTVTLITLSALWWMHLILYAVSGYTTVGTHLWPHFLYVAIMYLQVIFLLFFWYQSYCRMLRVGAGRLIRSAPMGFQSLSSGGAHGYGTHGNSAACSASVSFCSQFVSCSIGPSSSSTLRSHMLDCHMGKLSASYIAKENATVSVLKEGVEANATGLAPHANKETATECEKTVKPQAEGPMACEIMHIGVQSAVQDIDAEDGKCLSGDV